MNPRLQAWFSEYDQTHRHPMNRATHKVAIPLIVFHVVAMLGWLPLFTVEGHAITAGHLAVVAGTIFYASVSPLYAVIMLVFTSGCLWISQRMDAQLGPQAARTVIVGLAIFAWVVQLAGHAVWEKKSPAFVRNMVQALIGPIYFLALLLGHWQAPVWGDQVSATPLKS